MEKIKNSEWVKSNQKKIKTITNKLRPVLNEKIADITLVNLSLWFAKYNFEFSKKKFNNPLKVSKEKNWENLVLKKRANTNVAQKIDEHLEEINKKSKSIKLWANFSNLFNKKDSDKSLRFVIDELNSNQVSTFDDDEIKSDYRYIFNWILNDFLQNSISSNKNFSYSNHLKNVVETCCFLAKKYFELNFKNHEKELKIYNPNLKFGSFFIDLSKQNIANEVSFYAQEAKKDDLYLASLNLLMNNVEYDDEKEINLFLTNKSSNVKSTLKEDQLKKLRKSVDFCITRLEDENLSVYSNNEEWKNDVRWKNLPTSESSDVYYIYDILYKLNNNGFAFVVLKQSFTTNKTAQQARKYLIENDLIEAVVKLPDEKESSNCLLILNKNKNDNTKNKILFLDLDALNIKKEKIWNNFYLKFLNNDSKNLKIKQNKEILNSNGIKLDPTSTREQETDIENLSFEEKKEQYLKTISKLDSDLEDIMKQLNEFKSSLKNPNEI